MPGMLLRLGGVVVPVQSERPASDGRVHIPGVYEVLMPGYVRGELEGSVLPDPRLRLGATGDAVAVWDWLKAEGEWRIDAVARERAEIGASYEVPRWLFGGHSVPCDDSWPAWLRDHQMGVRTVRVCADDTVLPASRT